jgi:hypothetical protein
MCMNIADGQLPSGFEKVWSHVEHLFLLPPQHSIPEVPAFGELYFMTTQLWPALGSFHRLEDWPLSRIAIQMYHLNHPYQISHPFVPEAHRFGELPIA